MKVLYVEDNPLDAELTQIALSRTPMQFETEVLPNQRKALSRLLESPDFDILLSDLSLPDGSGLEIVSFLRERGIQRPAIILTGSGDESIAVAAFKAGAMDYIVKQDDYLSTLPAKLTSALERHRAELARRERMIRVLYAENEQDDIALTDRYLSRNAPHIRMDAVTSAGEVLRWCSDRTAANLVPDFPQYDVILLDYRLPEMTALDLMREIRRTSSMEIPVVLVTGQGSEEAAVQALRMGAADYLVKRSGYLSQLPAVLENAFYKAELIREKEALKRSEMLFRLLAENAQDIIYRYRMLPDPGYDYISPSVMKVTGFSPEEFYGNSRIDAEIVYPEDHELSEAMRSPGGRQDQRVVLRWVCKDGRVIWVEHRSTQIYNPDGQVAAIEGIARDITERRQRERELEVIAAVSAALRSAPDQEQMLPGVLDHVLDIASADGAFITYVDWQHNEMKVELGRGCFTCLTGQRLPFRFKESIEEIQSVIESVKEYTPGLLQFAPGDFPPNFLGGVDCIMAAPLNASGTTFGALVVGRAKKGSVERGDFTPEESKLLITLADNLANAIQRVRMFESLQQSNAELVQAYNATIEGWSKALDLRDKETEDHTERVTAMTVILARAAGFKEDEVPFLRWGALLHDIGKLGVPDGILHKPGPLDEKEWLLMKLHPVYAYRFLSPILYLGRAIDIPHCHHERWDGGGYPRHLAGEEIPLSARLFSIIDVWDALTTDRPYRTAWPKEKAAAYIREQAGKQFDPAVVELFFKTFPGD